jgi:serine/threonine protein kinase
VNEKLRRAVDQARVGRLSGTRLGEFAIDELLGRGGMGEVYAARRTSDGKDVAIKLLHAHLGADELLRARFRREAEVVTRMPAGTVAHVFQFGTSSDGYDYIVMERLRGEDMGALLKRRDRLDLAEVVHIVERIAAGLDGAHALGVVHRDLKPQNVFLCGELDTGQIPDVRLLDFGVARLGEALAATAMTATAAVIGTPGYMSPEQATGADIGPSADVFALGAIAYRALTGKPAFPSRNPASALFEALHHEPPPPSEVVPGLPDDVDAVIALALAKKSTERYQTAGEMARDLALAARAELGETARARAASLERSAEATAATMTAV